MFRLMCVLFLFSSTLGFSCPAGQYNQCILPRPWGGCAQAACVPNGGTIASAITGPLEELGNGIVHLKENSFTVAPTVSAKLKLSASSINWSNFDKIDWAAASFIGSAIANGAACILSDGTSPGAGIAGSSVVCSQNACACAVVSVVAAIKIRSDMSPDEANQAQALISNPKFAEILDRPSTQATINSQINELGLYQRPVDSHSGRSHSAMVLQPDHM